MSRRSTRSRITSLTAAAVTAALLVPAGRGASALPAHLRRGPRTPSTSVARSVVLAGEDGNPDRYSLLLPSGRTIALAKGFTAEPLSHFRGSVAVPGRRQRPACSPGRCGCAHARPRGRVGHAARRRRRARLGTAAPSPGPRPTTTYVAKVTNFGADRPDRPADPRRPGRRPAVLGARVERPDPGMGHGLGRGPGRSRSRVGDRLRAEQQRRQLRCHRRQRRRPGVPRHRLLRRLAEPPRGRRAGRLRCQRGGRSRPPRILTGQRWPGDHRGRARRRASA